MFSYSLIMLLLHYLMCGVKPAVLPNLQYLFPHRFAQFVNLDTLLMNADIREDLPRNSSFSHLYNWPVCQFAKLLLSLRLEDVGKKENRWILQGVVIHKIFKKLLVFPERPPNTATVGELLVGFFEYYATFDFDSLAISIRAGRVFHKSGKVSDKIDNTLIILAGVSWPRTNSATAFLSRSRTTFRTRPGDKNILWFLSAII